MQPEVSADVTAIEVDGPNLPRRTVLKYAAALAAGAPFLAKSRAFADISWCSAGWRSGIREGRPQRSPTYPGP